MHPKAYAYTHAHIFRNDLVSSNLKQKFEERVSIIAKPLAQAGLKPNHVTLMGLVTASCSALFYYYWRLNPLYLQVAGALVLLSGLLDAIDGVLARISEKTTVLGGFLDSITDRYSDAIVLGGIILSGLCDSLISIIALIGSLMVSYVRARSEAFNVKMSGIGLAERAERMIILAIFSFSTLYRVELLSYGVLLLAILSNLTVIQRILYFKQKN